MKNKKRKLSDKQLLITGGVTSAILLLIAVFVIFREPLFGDKNKTPDVNWGEIDVTGEISIDENETPEKEIDTYVDENGLIYERKYIYSMGFSIYIPQEWDVNTDNISVVYLTPNEENAEKYKGVELALTSTYLRDNQPEGLASNMLNFIRYNLVYHNSGYTFTNTSYSTCVEMLQKIEDINNKVWINSNNVDGYIEYKEKPSETGSWEQANHFIAMREYSALTMSAASNVHATPYYDFRYLMNGNIEYFLSGICPKDFSGVTETTLDVMMNSLKPIESLEDIRLPAFNTAQQVGDLTFKIPEDFKVQSQVNNTFRAEQIDFDSDDFGIGISVAKFSFPNEELVTTDLYNYVEFKVGLLNCLTKNNVSNIINDYKNEIVLSFAEIDPITIDGQKVEQYKTQLFLRTRGTELDVKSNTVFPSYGITYTITKGTDVYLVSVTYGEGNEAVAIKYARALSKTMSIN